MANTLAQALRDELLELLSPLAGLADPAAWRPMLLTMGHIDAVAGDASLQAALVATAGLVDELAKIDPAALATWDGAAQGLRAASDVIGAIRAVSTAVTDPAVATQARDLGVELVERLAASYLRRRHPNWHRAAMLLTLIDAAELVPPAAPVLDSAGKLLRMPWSGDRFHFERIGDLFSAPFATLRDAYFPNALAHVADAHLAAARLFPAIALLANTLRLRQQTALKSLDPPPSLPPSEAPPYDHFSQGEDPVDPPPAIDPDYLVKRNLPQQALLLPGQSDAANLGLIFTVSSAEHDGGVAGLIVGMAGSLTWTETRGDWRFSASSSGQVPAFVLGPGGLSLAPSTTPLTGATGKFSVERVSAPGAPAFLFGSATGSRLELGAVRFGVDFSLTPSASSLGLTVDVDHAKLVLAPGDGDGLLKKILPPDGVSLDCNAGVRLSSSGGLELGVSVNGASLSGEVPVGKSLGPIRLDALTRDFSPIGDDRGSGLTAAVGARISALLGPVTLSLTGPSVGVDLLWKLKDPSQTPNLGVVHLDGLGLRPPTGAALAVDAALVQGGGALAFDPPHHQYSGALELTIRDQIGLEVLGLLTTRLPDGRDGFSLLLLGNSTFPGIPIGFGFSLAGLGALIGVHRSIAVDPLRAALLAGHLDAALFPADPAAHLPSLLSTLDAMFPVRDGAFSIGLLAHFTWGPNALAKIDLGLFYDTSAPARLTALAQLLVEVPLARIRLQALGVLDFDEGELDLQARLFDSRIIGFDVSGDAAVMLRWGHDPAFVLSIGGFHPAFTPPTDFQKKFGPLQRITIRPHMDDSVLKLSLQAYIAVTSNTVQLGARLELGVDVSAFSVDGMLAFDALVQFSPSFWFDVSVEGGVSIKVFGMNLLSAHLGAEMTGPHPWWAKGTATITILWWDVDYDFEIGTRTGPPDGATLATSDVLTQLAGALTDPHNWTSQLGGHDALVSVRRPVSFALHPLDELEVRNRVLPLGIVIERLGDRPLDAPHLFDVTSLSVAGSTRETKQLPDDFARAQYQRLSDAEKLSLPSFEPMCAGLHALPSTTAATAPSVAVSWTWEERVWTPSAPPLPAFPAAVVDGRLVATALATSAAAEAPLRRSGVAKYRGALP
jgi:hypothetical protein